MLMSLFALCERRYHMDFEVKHLICAGLDVHKKTIVAAVCMESTGKYWIPVFNILETHMHVVLTHPKYVKAIKGKKTDKRDAKWIANLFHFDIVKASFIPPADIRALHELSRYRLKLSYMRSAEKNASRTV